MRSISFLSRQTKVERTRLRLFASFRDLVIFAVSALLAFELRFDGVLPTKYDHPLAIAVESQLKCKKRGNGKYDQVSERCK